MMKNTDDEKTTQQKQLIHRRQTTWLSALLARRSDSRLDYQHGRADALPIAHDMNHWSDAFLYSLIHVIYML